MIVVADTTPLNYLILIEQIEVLPALYGRIIIPEAVREELSRQRAPDVVRAWILNPPEWLEVRPHGPIFDPALLALDAGERNAIAIAEQIGAGLLMIDDYQGRLEADRRGLSFIGTIGVLKEANRRGLLDLRSAVERLRKTSFYISKAILDDLFNLPT